MAISMFLQGRFDLGVWAAAKMIPIALGILAIAKILVDKRVYDKKWFHRGVVAGSVVALALSRWAFARPRPSPLDPVFAAHHREVMREQRNQQQAQQQQQQRAKRMAEPTEEMKKALLERRGDAGRREFGRKPTQNSG